jgi:hypothetical protein
MPVRARAVARWNCTNGMHVHSSHGQNRTARTQRLPRSARSLRTSPASAPATRSRSCSTSRHRSVSTSSSQRPPARMPSLGRLPRAPLRRDSCDSDIEDEQCMHNMSNCDAFDAAVCADPIIAAACSLSNTELSYCEQFEHRYQAAVFVACSSLGRGGGAIGRVREPRPCDCGVRSSHLARLSRKWLAFLGVPCPLPRLFLG